MVLTLLLSAGALALVPPAQAADADLAAIDPCPQQDISGGVLFDVRVEYDANTNTCHYWVGLIDAYRLCRGIAGLEHYQLREDVTFAGATGAPRTVHVVVNYCAPVLTCACDPIEPAVDLDGLLGGAAVAWQPPIYCIREPCPGPYPPAVSWCALESATPASVRTLVWGTDAGCDIDVDTNWYCLYGEVPVDRTVGPVHVSTRVCTPPLPPIEPATSSAALPPVIVCVTEPCPPYPVPTVTWCRVESATPGAVGTLVWGTDEGCDVDVDTTDYYACAPPSGFVVERTAGPVHAVILVCDGGIPGALLDAIAEILRELISTN